MDSELLLNNAKSKIEDIVTILDKLIDQKKIKEEPRDELLDRLDDSKHRVLHYNENPYNQHFVQQRKLIERLTKENERLKARIELLEAGNDADMTRNIEMAVESAQELRLLKEQVGDAKKREEKIMSSFRQISMDFRKACYLLTGFRIDALKERKYRFSSMYAESPNDVLLFEISRDDSVQLLENDYSERLSEYVETYLERADSFPAFLASLTMDLFKASTQSQ